MLIKSIIIRRKYYKYKRYDINRFNTMLDYSIESFINIIRNGRCYYCGDDDDRLGFDRKFNNIGHILSNVVVSCGLCNVTRSDRFTLEEMIILGNAIRQIKTNRINNT